MSRFSESPSPPPHDVYEAPPRRGGRGGGGEYDDQWIGRSRSRPRGGVRGRGGSYVQPRSPSRSRSLRDDQDGPEDAEPPPRRRRHRTARHELPPESVEEAPRHRGERRRGERPRTSRHGEVAGIDDEAPRDRGRGRRDDRRDGGRDYARKMMETQQASMRAMMGGMMGMGGGMNPAAMQMAMMQQMGQMGQMGMMHPSYMQAMQQQQQMMLKQKKPSGGSSSSSGDSSSSSSDGVGNGMNPAAAMAAMAAMHGGMPGMGMHGHWPASASAAPPPLPPPPQAFGGPWICSCGFKNSGNNEICGGRGPMGCKAERPTPSMANLPPPPPPPPGAPGYQAGGGDVENIEAFLTANDINEEAAERLKALPQHLQISIMRRGPISDTRNPSAALLTRMRDVENAGGNSVGPSQSAENVPARQSAKKSIETMIDQFRLSPGVAWMMRAMAPDKQKLCSKIDPSGQADPSGYVAEQLKDIVGE